MNPNTHNKINARKMYQILQFNTLKKMFLLGILISIFYQIPAISPKSLERYSQPSISQIPIEKWSTYLGGNDSDSGKNIAVDSEGNIYIVGSTRSTDFPTVNAYDMSNNGDSDIYITKIAADGQSLIYSTYLGGSRIDSVWSFTIDSEGCVYICGYTNSTDFPTINAYDSTFNGGGEDCFITKLAADGRSLIYSTYLGGSELDRGYGIAVDTQGFTYVTGTSWSTNFPTVNAYNATSNGLSDIFLAKLSISGQSLIYSTYLGGSKSETGSKIIVSDDGCVYITGYTTSTNFPTFNAYNETYSGFVDAFVTKIAADGQSLIFSTYLGGSYQDSAISVAVDTLGYVYITGSTYSPNFPTINAYDATYNEDYDVFVTKFSPDGQSLIYSTYLGGFFVDRSYDIVVDTKGCAYITGLTEDFVYPTNRTKFPIINAVDTNITLFEGFVTKLATDGQSLIFSTYLGGSMMEQGWGIAVNPIGCIYVTGSTNSLDFPVNNSYDATFNGEQDCFVTHIALDCEPIKIDSALFIIGGYPIWSIEIIAFIAILIFIWKKPIIKKKK